MNRLCRVVCFYELLKGYDMWIDYVIRMRSHGVDDIWGWLDCSGSRYWLDEVKDDGDVWVELRDRWLCWWNDDVVSKGSVDEEWLYESGLRDGSV